jgi:hypothetical protein
MEVFFVIVLHCKELFAMRIFKSFDVLSIELVDCEQTDRFKYYLRLA